MSPEQYVIPYSARLTADQTTILPSFAATVQEDVERKLSKMILDKQFCGILDQGLGVLVVFEEGEEDEAYKGALETVTSMGEVVDNLYGKVKHIH